MELFRTTETELQHKGEIEQINLSLSTEKGMVVDVPRRVGFDRIVVGVKVYKIDWDTLKERVRKEKQYAEEKMKTVTLWPVNDEDLILSVCQGEPRICWYSSIQIRIGADTFLLRKCNISGRSDISKLEVHVKAPNGHECLGNIRNYTCEHEQERVRNLYNTLERQYGIYLDNSATLKEAEINVNVVLNKDRHCGNEFEFAARLLKNYQLYLDGFTHDTYTENKDIDIKPKRLNLEFINPNTNNNQILLGYYANSKMVISDLENNLMLKQPYRYSCFIEFSNKIRGKKLTSIDSTSPTRDVNIYDKSFETEMKSNRNIRLLDRICRVEYTIRREKEIKSYFGKTDLFILTQHDVERAFHKLSEKLIKGPIDMYYRKVNKEIEGLFERRITKDNWRSQLVYEIVNIISRQNGIHYILTEEELDIYVRLLEGRSVKKNATRIKKSLIEQIDKIGSELIVVEEERISDCLLNWLINVAGDEEQMIYYILAV